MFVRAVEFQTNGAPIHHAVIRVDRTGVARARRPRRPDPVRRHVVADVQDPDGQFIGWAPGRGPIVSPDGMPWHLNRGDDLVVELHLAGGEEAARGQPRIALFLTERRRCGRR